MEKNITNREIELFKEYLYGEEKSNGTIEKYCRDIRDLQAWLNGKEINKERLNEWKRTLIESGKAITTINSMIAAVNAFFKYKDLNEFTMKSIRVQKQFFRSDDRELNRQEYEKLINTAYNEGKIRIALLMETMAATGIRVSETKYITREAVEQRRVEISLKGKIRVILLPKELCQKLIKYAKQNRLKEHIFVTKTGKCLDRRQIWSEMKDLCKAAGIERKKVFPHNLRHLFARCFYKTVKDVAGLADVLGHSSIETTRIYLMSTEKEYHKKIARLNLVLQKTGS